MRAYINIPLTILREQLMKKGNNSVPSVKHGNCFDRVNSSY